VRREPDRVIRSLAPLTPIDAGELQMSASTYQLIGQMISAPRPAPRFPMASKPAARTDEPLHVLIGRILGPPAVHHDQAAVLAA
jgi:hypothetical protein